jgi:hypothetical protein
MTPMTAANYLGILGQLNQGWWPMQVGAYAVALATVGLALAGRVGAGRLVAALAAVLWLSSAGVFHLAGFTRLSPAGYAFAGLFVWQAMALLVAGLRGPGLSFGWRADGYGVMGALLVVHALVGHPLLSIYLDQPWPRLGLVGLDPNPTVLFTLGLLLLSTGRLPKYLLAAPVLWSFLGFLLAVDLGLRQDVVILPAGLAAASLPLPRDMKLPGDEPGGA